MFFKWFTFNPKTTYYKLDRFSKKYDKCNSMDKHILQNGTIKKTWVPKGTILVANLKGPKKTWIPKTPT